MREPILVTGATGFIGRHLVGRLQRDGRQVRAFVLPQEEAPSSWGEDVEVHRGDVGDGVTVEPAVEGAGTVIHLAAVVEDWGAEDLHQRVTVDGTEHVLGAAARNGARAVLASSIVVYGERLRTGLCHEDAPMGQPLGPYSRSKQAQERIARRLESEAGLDLSIVRPSNVFGPGSRPWVHEVLTLLRQGGITLIGGGDQNAGLCHVDNLVDVLLRAASEDQARGRVYNAADGSDVTWKQYFGDLARLAGTNPPRSAPLWLAKPLAVLCENIWKVGTFSRRPPITREAINLVGSHHRVPVDRARDELGYVPLVGYGEAIRGLEASFESSEV